MQAIALKDGLAQRLGGPGGLYNLGNGLGLLGGVSFHVAAASGTGWAALSDYFVGSLGATAITLAMLIFFWSGEQYHKAWAHGAPPDARLNRVGDVSSGWGALMLGLGLVLIGHPVLAAVLMDPNAAVGVADLEGAAASGLLVLCYGLWLKADVALMRG